MMNQYNSLAIVAIALIAGVSNALSTSQDIAGSDQRAEIGEFPHQVSLRLDGYHFCGGSLIDHRRVLTARQCVEVVEKPHENLTIATGSIELNGGQIHTVKEIHYYDMDNSNEVYHDIAIVEVSEHIPFDNKQKFVRLSHKPLLRGATAEVTGWPTATSRTSSAPSHYLRKIPVTIKDVNRPNSSTNVGVSPVDSEICYMDIGAPLVSNNELVGIANLPCGNGSDVAYVNVPFYYPWIKKVMLNE